MPQVLIKADDLRLGQLTEGWQKFFAFCKSENIYINAGVIGEWPSQKARNESDIQQDAQEMFQQLLGSYSCSIWNHGYLHRRDNKTGLSDFRGPPLNEQIRYLRLTQDRVAKLSGVRMTAFGPPFNWSDQNTILALQHVSEIRYVFYVSHVPGKVCYHGELFVECEPFQGEVKPGAKRMFSLSQAKSRSERFLNLRRDFVLQIHPNSWADGAIDEFASYLGYLRKQGYMTASVEGFSSLP